MVLTQNVTTVLRIVVRDYYDLTKEINSTASTINYDGVSYSMVYSNNTRSEIAENEGKDLYNRFH